MRIISASTEILAPAVESFGMLQRIEVAARTCYKSEANICGGSAAKLVRGLIRHGHEAMLEHASITVRFTVDRGVSHELVRHRMASFAQESTRYCNYGLSGFGTEITFIRPCYMDKNSAAFAIWKRHMQQAEDAYFNLLDFGLMPQEARAVLPVSLKTEVIMTANIREWRHFFKLRAAGLTGAPHPQMLEVAVPLLNDMKSQFPVVFDDIKPMH
ncbi:FAD-dependent thymidylate synthase [uncultured Megasphaera sp.]|uniref:FAD-dependent thymidylate synthase n=1 Tax=uncultured Megasphaera sp. TaxID=165188 RepID=UPI00259436F0|nr:FAD-dependent thymidylate synthase [uncultured Megasphaera sp.]